MSDIDELDRLYQETKRKTWTFDRSVNEIDYKDVRSVFKVAARYEAEAAARYAVAVANAWPGISARLRAAEAEVERLRAEKSLGLFEPESEAEPSSAPHGGS